MARYKKGVWSGRNQKILEMLEAGKLREDIAKAVGINPATIWKIAQTDEFKKRQAEFHEKVGEKARKLFESKAVEAAEKIIQIARMGTSQQRIQLDASKEILYMIGIKPIEVVETRERVYAPEEIASAAKTLGEVEATMDRISVKKSRFILTKQEKPRDVSEQPEDIGETVTDRQEDVSEEPVLPVQGSPSV